MAAASAFLAILAGCSKQSSNGGGTTPSNDPPKAAEAKISLNNLKQLGIAMQSYHDSMGHLPPPGRVLDRKTPPQPNQLDHLSWRVALLPYIEHSDLFNRVLAEMSKTGLLPENLSQVAISTYANPKMPATSNTHYRVFVGNGAAFDSAKPTRFADFTDGTSETILIVEVAEPVNWTTPEDLLYDPKSPLPKFGIFDGGFHALMADGSVRWIPSDTPEATIRAMITRNGGEQFTLPGKRVDSSGRTTGANNIQAPSEASAGSKAKPNTPPDQKATLKTAPPRSPAPN